MTSIWCVGCCCPGNLELDLIIPISSLVGTHEKMYSRSTSDALPSTLIWFLGSTEKAYLNHVVRFFHKQCTQSNEGHNVWNCSIVHFPKSPFSLTLEPIRLANVIWWIDRFLRIRLLWRWEELFAQSRWSLRSPWEPNWTRILGKLGHTQTKPFELVDINSRKNWEMS